MRLLRQPIEASPQNAHPTESCREEIRAIGDFVLQGEHRKEQDHAKY
jgi:hypothetical protein